MPTVTVRLAPMGIVSVALFAGPPGENVTKTCVETANRPAFSTVTLKAFPPSTMSQ